MDAGHGSSKHHPSRALADFAQRRQLLFGVVAVAVATLLFMPGRAVFDDSIFGLGYLLVILTVGGVAGERSAAAAAMVAFLAWNYFFIPPYYTFQIRDARLYFTLVTFLAVGLVVGLRTASARHRERDAIAREREALILHDLSRRLLVSPSQEEDAREILKVLAGWDDAGEVAVLLADDNGSLRQFWSPEPETWRADVLAAAERMLRGLRPDGYDSETPPFGADGRAILVPLASGTGIAGAVYVGLASDIQEFTPSDRRLVSSVANMAASHLEQLRMAERARRLDVLREADGLKSAFVSGVSHELKTPIAASLATVTGLLDGEHLDEYTASELDSVVRDLKRLEANIVDLIDLSRLQTASWRSQADRFEIGEVIGTVIAAFSRRDRSRVSLHVAEDLPPVCIDFRQVARALSNLVENALAYSPEDTDVIIGARVLGDALVVWVEDRGPGVPETERLRIFEKFYKAGEAPRGRVSTGLGLAIVKEIVVGHGGRVWVEDADEGGARFSFTLPLRNGEEGCDAG